MSIPWRVWVHLWRCECTTKSLHVAKFQTTFISFKSDSVYILGMPTQKDAINGYFVRHKPTWKEI